MTDGPLTDCTSGDVAQAWKTCAITSLRYVGFMRSRAGRGVEDEEKCDPSDVAKASQLRDAMAGAQLTARVASGSWKGREKAGTATATRQDDLRRRAWEDAAGLATLEVLCMNMVGHASAICQNTPSTATGTLEVANELVRVLKAHFEFGHACTTDALQTAIERDIGEDEAPG